MIRSTYNRIFSNLVFLHIGFFILGTSFFVLLFHTSILKGFVFFYRGIGLLSLTTFLMTILLLRFRKTRYGKTFTIRDVIVLVILLFCINLVFFTHVPVTADRSVSVFLLGYMNNQKDKPVNKTEMTQVFIDKFLRDNDGIQKRIDEQIVSGNIKEFKNGYLLTKQGEFLMKFYSFVTDIFTINKRNVYP